ncbi:hypothetical protein J4N45_10560 [Vibrio sp. SCSIO 43140]|uniref:hypothetical protein n=1 Tax=Vibrio sp. SCSIO 43140 TaxID=2819100 RepID=UPI002075DED8|nr:hypothetical protein [Vibrio sp. SCSIO 43140]USD58972.1 hypothetical protein J4N45_10560 [Vibrio sp. SCSIO 43140]
MLSDNQVKQIQPAMAAFSSYVTSPSDEQKSLIEQARKEGLVNVRAKYLVSWTDKGVARFRSANGFS